jgi:hypothetical protein
MRPRTAFLAGLGLQGVALVLALYLVAVNPYVVPRWVVYALAPGVPLFWAEGVHSGRPLAGLALAAGIGAMIYGALVYAGASLWRAYRRAAA